MIFAGRLGRGNFIGLAPHGEAHGRAPQAGVRLVHAEDGLVSPLGRHGGQRLRVGIIRRGINRDFPYGFLPTTSVDSFL